MGRPLGWPDGTAPQALLRRGCSANHPGIRTLPGVTSVHQDQSMLRELFARAAGRCECRLSLCAHHRRCDQTLDWGDHGSGWRALNIRLTEDVGDPENWLVLCHDCLRQWPHPEVPTLEPAAALATPDTQT